MQNEQSVKFRGHFVEEKIHKNEGVQNLRENRGDIVPQPQKSAVGFPFQIRENKHIVELGDEKRRDAGENHPQRKAEDGRVFVVVGEPLGWLHPDGERQKSENNHQADNRRGDQVEDDIFAVNLFDSVSYQKKQRCDKDAHGGVNPPKIDDFDAQQIRGGVERDENRKKNSKFFVHLVILRFG